MTYKKYFNIIIIIIGSIIIYNLLKHKPDNLRGLIQSGTNCLKYIPIDKNSKDILTPILDLTNNSFIHNYNNEINPSLTSQEKRIINSGSHPNINNDMNIVNHKRAVSETKKRYIASSQEWKCGNCKNILNHTYEIDHKIALKNGGDNSVDNLIALCRECHGIKTARENMK